MDAVAVLWRSQLRRRWRAWVALTLLLAIGAGTGMACFAGARRTASAFDRYAEASGFPDVNTGHGEPPAEAESTIDGFDGVASHATVVGFVGFVEDLDRETDRATGPIWSVIALLALTVLASLAHALTGNVRRHRRNYATFKAIGFTRRQVLGLVTWQSTAPIVLALLLALPLGTALGDGGGSSSPA